MFQQLVRGRFRISGDPAPASRYVCESDVCGTNGVDRRSWQQRTRPHMHRVHNRCTADKACSCECAIKRALSDLEMNIDIADSSTPDSASGSPVVTSAQNSSWIGSVLSPEITSTILLLDSCFHSTHVHVLTQAQRGNKDVLIVLNAIRTWILLQRDEEVSYADKHRIVYFLKVVSELVATLYFKFNVANVKQLWKALCPAVCRYDQCCRQSLRIALVQLQSLVLGCERLMFAKFNSQCRNKLRFLSAVCSEWNVLLSAKLRSYRRLWPPFTPGFAESKLRDLTVPRVNDVGFNIKS